MPRTFFLRLLNISTTVRSERESKEEGREEEAEAGEEGEEEGKVMWETRFQYHHRVTWTTEL